jgi:ribulose 1,5-bisphosphate synthetase/thiazole synthase
MKTQPSHPEEYDLLVLGSGAAGKLISWTLAKKGMKTAVIERKYVGGWTNSQSRAFPAFLATTFP